MLKITDHRKVEKSYVVNTEEKLWNDAVRVCPLIAYINRLNPLLYVPGSTGYHDSGGISFDWIVRRVRPPLFIPGEEYATSYPKESLVHILLRFKFGSYYYLIFHEGRPFSYVAEQDLLQYCLYGIPFNLVERL